jgi:hypothetical protein
MFYFLMNCLDSYSKKLSSITLAKMDNVILGLDVLLGVMSVYLTSSSSFLYHGRCKLQRERERERPFKNKGERSNNKGGNGHPVGYEYEMAHPLV